MEKVNSQETEEIKKLRNQCKKCVLDKCACNNEVCSYAYKQYGMKKWVYGIIITVISIGLVVPFLSETILTVWFPSASLGLNTWNQFVSIILGIIATTLSIVSMIMSFKNYDDGLVLHEKHIETLEKIASISKDVNYVREKLDKINLTADAKSEKPYIPENEVWGEEPPIKTI